mgnify:FL=1
MLNNIKIKNSGLALNANNKRKIEVNWINNHDDQYSLLEALPLKSVLFSIRTLYTLLKKSFILNKLYLNIYFVWYEK